jgi:Leucine-rich repeat (LRR) protein
MLFAQFEGPIINSISEANKKPLEVIVLDLSGQRLDKLPEDIFQYKNLQRLRLNRTFIDELPARIEELTELKALELNHPKTYHLEFDALPSTISNLKNLTYIGLIGLPNLDWKHAMGLFAELPNLDNLALMKNDFKTLPDGIEKLTALRKIWLGGNVELAAEDVFDKLPQIVQVGFGGSQYQKLPDNISNAKAISNLWLANNQLTSVEPLIELKELKSIALNSNGLTALPKGIRELTGLASLSLDSNAELNWAMAFEDLATLSGLKRLSLSNNNLEKGPETLYKLNHLEVLILRGNPLDEAAKVKIAAMLPNTKIVY